MHKKVPLTIFSIFFIYVSLFIASYVNGGNDALVGQSVTVQIKTDQARIIAVGSPYASSGWITSEGQVSAYSADGNLLWEVYGQNTRGYLGSSVTTPSDISGDNFPDVVAGAWGVNNLIGSVFAFNGRDGTLLWESSNPTRFPDYYGSSVSAIGDTNGDKVSDVAVGAPRAGGDFGQVYLLSGDDGRQLWTAYPLTIGTSFGYSVSVLPDVTQDGINELVVGAPANDIYRGKGKVYVLNGANGNIERVIEGKTNGDLFGTSVSGIDDVDGDGLGDFVVGAPGFDNGKGRAYLYRSADGLLTFDGTRTSENFGWAVSNLPDIDGDNREEVIMTNYYEIQPSLSEATIYTSKGNTQVVNWASTHGIISGHGVIGIRNVNDGYAGDLAVVGNSVNYPTLYIHSGLDPAGQSLWSALGGHYSFGISISSK